MRSHHHGAITIADARSGGEQDVLIRDVWIGVIGDGAQLVFALAGFLIQRLDVFEHMPEGEQGAPDFPGSERVEHIGVIGIRTVRAHDFGDGSKHG